MSVKSLSRTNRSFSALTGQVPEHHVLIAESTVGAGGAASVTFSNIPADYQHLQMRGVARLSGAFTATETGIRVNSDTGSNYTAHQVYGDGTSASSGIPYATNPQTVSYLLWCAGANLSSNVFNAFTIDILDYASTSKNKTFRCLNGWDNNGSGFVLFRSGLWMSTSAINSITFGLNPNNANLVQYSSVSLYGIK